MATPFVTGVVALLLSLNPSATPAEIKATIQRTAHPIAESGNSTLTSVSWQGAGLIDAYNAYHFETVISPSEILLNDTANYVQPTITVVNKDTFKKVYQIRYRPALSISKWSNEENPYYWVSCILGQKISFPDPSFE
jgi:subtilisin family serine protease